MNQYAIKFENIGKQYRLGMIGTGTVSHDLNRWWARIRGKEDPFLKVGLGKVRSGDSSEDYIWALRDINFEVRKGEVLGIIGKNGAGKSTLLKILSKITAPTTGTINGVGRIASLLEVGTGFHPEMTGRENVFMNGAIMGMSKREIKRKFDEIVSFAGVESYVDTPVKRYSSGMLVRLGFAVAAHLEPEILVVDEVLAVGDAEFQKKCIGKMESISHEEGRTILFVSHNMTAVENLCKKALVLDKGRMSFLGDVKEGVDFYLNEDKHTGNSILTGITFLHSDFEINQICLNDSEQNIISINPGEHSLEIKISGELKSAKKLALEVRFYDKWQSIQALYSPGHLKGELYDLQAGKFDIIERIELPKNMTSGEYYLDIDISHPNYEWYMKMPKHIKLNVNGIKGVTGLEFQQENCGLLML